MFDAVNVVLKNSSSLFPPILVQAVSDFGGESASLFESYRGEVTTVVYRLG